MLLKKKKKLIGQQGNQKGSLKIPWDRSSLHGSGKKETPGHLAPKASGACVQELHRTEGSRHPILERHTQAIMCTGSQGKAEAPLECGLDLTAVLGGYPRKTGGDCSSLWGKDIGGKSLGNIHQPVFLQRWHLGKIRPHSSVLRTHRPNNNLGGITAPPISKQAA